MLYAKECRWPWSSPYNINFFREVIIVICHNQHGFLQAHRNNWLSTPDAEFPQEDTVTISQTHLLNNNSQPPRAIVTAQILSNETRLLSTVADEDLQDKEMVELPLKHRDSTVSYDSYPRTPVIKEEISLVNEKEYLAPLLVLQAC
jgi:hypothetical protein